MWLVRCFCWYFGHGLNFLLGLCFCIWICLLSGMITEHFYIRNDALKPAYTKINFDNVIMVYSDGTASHFYLMSGQEIIKIKVQLSIADCYIKYFKRMEEFIRSSSDYIININHIVGVNKPKNGYMDIEMRGNNKAMLRLSHLYAQKILRSDKKSAPFATLPRQSTDSVKKDEIILEYPNAMQARKKIKEDLGEKVGIAYIRQRMRTLSSYESWRQVYI